MSIISGTSIVEFKNSLNEYEEKGIVVSKFRNYIKEFINKNKEKKQKKTRNPSDYNKFVKECMLNDDDIKKEGLTQGEKMKICAKKWEDYKNDNPGLFEKKESNKDKDNQKKINVLPKKIKIKLDIPVDSDDNSDDKKEEKKVKKEVKEVKKKDKKEAKEAEKKAKKEAKEAEKKAKKEAKEVEKKAKKEAKNEDSSDDEYDFDANVDSYLDDE
jgi:acetylornithine deacetylase/succinyl-diaminopimelate desuccinylase-like protein